MRVFLPKKLALVRRLLENVENESAYLPLTKENLEKMKYDMQALVQTLERSLVERKKSLQVVEKSNECLLNNAKELRDNMAMCENKCQGSSNLINVDQERTLVIKLATSLKEMEGDL
jgi:hypothetical protein